MKILYTVTNFFQNFHTADRVLIGPSACIGCKVVNWAITGGIAVHARGMPIGRWIKIFSRVIIKSLRRLIRSTSFVVQLHMTTSILNELPFTPTNILCHCRSNDSKGPYENYVSEQWRIHLFAKGEAESQADISDDLYWSHRSLNAHRTATNKRGIYSLIKIFPRAGSHAATVRFTIARQQIRSEKFDNADGGGRLPASLNSPLRPNNELRTRKSKHTIREPI